MSGRLFYWVANWSLSRAEAALLLKEPVLDMVDCIHANVGQVRPHLHPNGLHVIAGYITGSPDIQWTAEDFNSIPHGIDVLRIDQSNGSNQERAIRWIAKDEEPGASTAQTAVQVAGERIHAGEDELIYVDQSGLPIVEQLAAHAGLPHGEIIAYQYASPTTNPHTPLPGSSAELAQVNADLSVISRAYVQAAVGKPGSSGSSSGSGSGSTLDAEELDEWHNWHNQGYNAALDELEAWAKQHRRPNKVPGS
jgi:hypothetical protein